MTPASARLGGAVTLRGTALHSGDAAEVCIEKRAGPIIFAQGAAEAPLFELRATRTDRGLRVESSDARVSIDSAEHLLAAIGGLGVRSGVCVRVPVAPNEIPLLDGGARLFCEALFAIGADCGHPSRLIVARSATLRHGSSMYTFSPPSDADPVGSARSRVSVDVCFPDPVGRESASFGGDPAEFFAEIAPSRTFGWASERDALIAQGRARGVDLKSVIVFGSRGTIEGCRANEPGEIARHKLLDLVGDLALYGGPPRGSVSAFAPGHTATHAVVAEAIASGVIVRDAP